VADAKYRSCGLRRWSERRPLTPVGGVTCPAVGLKAMKATYLVGHLKGAKRLYTAEQLEMTVRRLDERCRVAPARRRGPQRRLARLHQRLHPPPTAAKILPTRHHQLSLSEPDARSPRPPLLGPLPSPRGGCASQPTQLALRDRARPRGHQIPECVGDIVAFDTL
jgi:hypothetical protein